MSPAHKGGEGAGQLRSHTLLRPAILLLLREREGHGYELTTRLEAFGVDGCLNTGSLYRTLRLMADEGLLSSAWDAPAVGPARRIYAITTEGHQYLRQAMPDVAQVVQVGSVLLDRYGGKRLRGRARST